MDNLSTVQTMLADGFDPNTPDEKGQLPLYVALRDEAGRVVEALLASPRLQADRANAANETPLMMAALRGNLAAAQALAKKGAAINRPGWTPLHYAATGPKSLPVLQWLLEQGAAVEAASPNQTTPLMMAARYGSEDSARALLTRGASAKARNEQQLNAADFARLAGRDSLAVLLDADAAGR